MEEDRRWEGHFGLPLAASGTRRTPFRLWTEYTDFVVRRGAAVLEDGTERPQAGHEIRLLPMFVASARPSGVVLKAAYLRLKAELLGELHAALPVDGVYLDLHGAMQVKGIGDGETDTGKIVKHRYLWPGTYSVVLTVTDNDGGKADFIERVKILGGPPCPGDACSDWAEEEGGSCS